MMLISGRVEKSYTHRAQHNAQQSPAAELLLFSAEMAAASFTTNDNNATPEHEAIFDDIQSLTTGTSDERADAYTKLVKKEARVLKTVDRVVNKARAHAVDERTFLNLSLTDVTINTMQQLQLMFDDALRVRAPADFKRVLWDGDRKIYVGLVLVLASFLLFFTHITS